MRSPSSSNETDVGPQLRRVNVQEGRETGHVVDPDRAARGIPSCGCDLRCDQQVNDRACRRLLGTVVVGWRGSDHGVPPTLAGDKLRHATPGNLQATRWHPVLETLELLVDESNENSPGCLHPKSDNNHLHERVVVAGTIGPHLADGRLRDLGGVHYSVLRRGGLPGHASAVRSAGWPRHHPGFERRSRPRPTIGILTTVVSGPRAPTGRANPSQFETAPEVIGGAIRLPPKERPGSGPVARSLLLALPPGAPSRPEPRRPHLGEVRDRRVVERSGPPRHTAVPTRRRSQAGPAPPVGRGAVAPRHRRIATALDRRGSPGHAGEHAGTMAIHLRARITERRRM